MNKEEFNKNFNSLDLSFKNQFNPLYNSYAVRGETSIELSLLRLMQLLNYEINFLKDDVSDKFNNVDYLRKSVKCPYCNNSYFKELSVGQQAAYYPPIYKDGININPDKNETFTRCYCINCEKHFTYVTKLDELIEIRGDESEK